MLFLIEESKEAAGEKEEASYIWDNVKKHESRRSEPYSKTKHYSVEIPEQQKHIYTRQEKIRSKARSRAAAADQRGEGEQVDGGAYNLKGAYYFMYSLDVVHPYTDQNLQLDTDKSRKKNQKEPG